MDIQVGDVIQTKKPHPCGANRFDVLRVGMDFKIKCQGCGHEIMLPRAKIERNIGRIWNPPLQNDLVQRRTYAELYRALRGRAPL